MPTVDPYAESQRLRILYGGMEDSELSALAAQAETLTEIARQVLTDELKLRSMEPPPPLRFTATKSAGDAIPAEPVMIRRYVNQPMAALAKSALDSAGIESFLVDENSVGLSMFHSSLIGGVKLLVKREDAEEATRVLDDVVAADKEEHESWESED